MFARFALWVVRPCVVFQSSPADTGWYSACAMACPLYPVCVPMARSAAVTAAGLTPFSPAAVYRRVTSALSFIALSMPYAAAMPPEMATTLANFMNPAAPVSAEAADALPTLAEEAAASSPAAVNRPRESLAFPAEAAVASSPAAPSAPAFPTRAVAVAAASAPAAASSRPAPAAAADSPMAFSASAAPPADPASRSFAAAAVSAAPAAGPSPAAAASPAAPILPRDSSTFAAAALIFSAAASMAAAILSALALLAPPDMPPLTRSIAASYFAAASSAAAANASSWAMASPALTSMTSSIAIRSPPQRGKTSSGEKDGRSEVEVLGSDPFRHRMAGTAPGRLALLDVVRSGLRHVAAEHLTRPGVPQRPRAFAADRPAVVPELGVDDVRGYHRPRERAGAEHRVNVLGVPQRPGQHGRDDLELRQGHVSHRAADVEG